MLDNGNGKWDPALRVLLSTLEEAENSEISSDELSFLHELLSSPELNALVQIHSSIDKKDERFTPLISNGIEILHDVFSSEVGGDNPELVELNAILSNPFLQGILYCHDVIAQKDFLPRLLAEDEVDGEEEEEQETVKIVQLVKSSESLGATIKKDEESGKIVIARVMHGGAADRSGLIFTGDEVIEVNGIDVDGKSPDDILQILKNSEGTITFKLIPADSGRTKRESKVRVRCLFNFNPSEDPHIPCKEAGLKFRKGDILHIVSQDDIYWWQARIEGDKSMYTGLIPSKALQERRIVMARTKTDGENDDFDREDIPTYEEVIKMYPRSQSFRPLVLIGPPGIGRNELKRRLIESNPLKYQTTIPYTSRPQRGGEMNGKEYYFIERERMEEEIQGGKFIEFGEYKGNLYGTSSESISSIISASKVAVLNPHSQALKVLRSPQFKPYIIYIKPPDFEVLKTSRHLKFAKSTFDDKCQRAFNDDEFHEILKSSERLEFNHGHLFDETIVNDDLSRAFEQLLKIAQKVETEPLWVPANWAQ